MVVQHLTKKFKVASFSELGLGGWHDFVLNHGASLGLFIGDSKGTGDQQDPQMGGWKDANPYGHGGKKGDSYNRYNSGNANFKGQGKGAHKGGYPSYGKAQTHMGIGHEQ